MKSSTIVLLLAIAAESWCVQFEPNLGQTGASVRYYARGSEGAVFLTEDAILLHRAGDGNPVQLRFLNAGSRARWIPQDQAPGRTTYLNGRDPKRWVKDVPAYRSVTRRELYPAIDAVFYGTDGELEYDLRLAPGARVSDIRIRTGHALALNRDGGLRIGDALVQRKPIAYQIARDGSRRAVPASYRLLGSGDFGFSLGRYDAALPVVIDPVLETAEYFGGAGEDRIVGIDSGSVRAGMTTSIDVPGAPFARRKGYDAFVQMPTSQGPVTVVIGGSGNEIVTSVASSGTEIVVGGYTDSTDLPTEFGSFSRRVFQPEYQGGATDGFLILISDQRSISYYISYIGSPADDRVTAVGGMRGWQQFLVAGTTTGRGMDRAWAPERMVANPDPLGGTDGFVMDLSTGGAPRVNSFSYIGGPADDIPRAITPDLAGGFLVAGETASSQFSGVNSTLNSLAGNSDGFLLRLSSAAIGPLRYIGGSAADRIDGLKIGPLGTLYVGGTTASPDLPVLNPAQQQYGGGPSDAFWGVLSANLNDLRSLSFHGGAGAEETTVVEAYDTGYVAGWTSSPDMPVREPVQAAFGGGSDDAFVLEADGEGLLSSTFFGGNGSDRPYSLAASSDRNLVTLAGETTSTDLPADRGSTLRGASDGFAAQISSRVIRAFPVAGAKGFRARAGVKIGPIGGRAPRELTITSSDPSTVLLAVDEMEQGQASIRLTSPPNVDTFWHAFWADCLADTGGATLTISAPGYQDTTTPVSCFKPKLQVQLAMPAPARVRLTQSLRLYLRIVPHEGDFVSPQIRDLVPQPGQSAPPIEVRTSNPAIGKLNHTRLIPGTDSFANVVLETLAVGELKVSFSAPEYSQPEYILPVTVGSPVSAPPRLTVAGGFQGRYSASVLMGTTPTRNVTLASGDPGKLLIATDTRRLGEARWDGLTAGLLPVLSLQALASEGEVPLTLTVEGFEPVVTLVSLVPARAHVSSNRLLDSLKTGEIATLTVRVETGVLGTPLMLPNPGQSTSRVGIAVEPAGVAELSTSALEIGAEGSATVELKAISPGSALLSLRKVETLDVAATALPVRVITAALRETQIELGKDLSAPVQIPLPFAPPGPVTMTIRSSDPSLVLVSSTTTGAGAAQASLTLPAATIAAQFHVHGLQSSGTAQLTVDFPPFGTTTIPVTLRPSGVGWASESLQTYLYGQQPEARLQAFALDPGTLSPIAVQAIRPGVPTAVVRVVSTDSNIAAPAQDTVDLARGVYSVRLNLSALGLTTLSLEQPPGFTPPAVRKDLRVTVDPRTLILNSTDVAKDTVSLVRITGTQIGLGLPPIKIASSDPSRLLVSRRLEEPGQPSIQVEQTFQAEFYIHALTDEGSVDVTVSADNFKPAAAPMRLVPVGVVAAASLRGEAVWSGGKIYLTPSGAVDISLRLASLHPANGTVALAGLSPRPGAGPWQVEVKSSNPAVFQAEGSALTVGSNSEQRLLLKPIGAGEAEIIVSQPPGFREPAGARITVVVTDKLPLLP